MRFNTNVNSARSLIAMGLCIACFSCHNEMPTPGSSDAQAQAAAAPATTQAAFLKAVGEDSLLPNARYVTEKVIAGAQPEGDEAFKALRDLGVKTIVSVDGARPDVAAARKYGLTYVHLPITYSGVTPAEGKSIAKALEELPGLIYLHCHHGKHRSAAAVAVACVYNGMLAPERAEAVLQTFGTGANYKGLWQAARDARPLDPKSLDEFKMRYVEAKPIPPLAEAMVSVDEHFDHIKDIQKAGWTTPRDHPDLDGAHEAMQLVELFREAPRTGADLAKSPEFVRLMSDAEQGSAALQQALAARPPDPMAAEIAAKRVAGSCTACHKAFRD